ncbi:DUF2946 family protein [Fontimonas sp. SYSU GA230001]|uniref:DUF2946 family protein n=1 Tax=Fontimonas sp. SYSU GA230001 TaxID=3142450 RepID=UPI0032B52DBC
MKPARRHRPLVALLGGLAILGQLLLPTLHAQAWARQRGDPLLYAICGNINPALLREMRRVTPHEVLRKLQQDRAPQSAADCTLCLTVHGGAPLASVAVAVAAAGTDAAAPIPIAPVPASAPHLRLPPSRGPPAVA